MPRVWAQAWAWVVCKPKRGIYIRLGQIELFESSKKMGDSGMNIC